MTTQAGDLGTTAIIFKMPFDLIIASPGQTINLLSFGDTSESLLYLTYVGDIAILSTHDGTNTISLPFNTLPTKDGIYTAYVLTNKSDNVLELAIYDHQTQLYQRTEQLPYSGTYSSVSGNITVFNDSPYPMWLQDVIIRAAYITPWADDDTPPATLEYDLWNDNDQWFNGDQWTTIKEQQA